jgi:hypothetical protein
LRVRKKNIFEKILKKKENQKKELSCSQKKSMLESLRHINIDNLETKESYHANVIEKVCGELGSIKKRIKYLKDEINK